MASLWRCWGLENHHTGARTGHLGTPGGDRPALAQFMGQPLAVAGELIEPGRRISWRHRALKLCLRQLVHDRRFSIRRGGLAQGLASEGAVGWKIRIRCAAASWGRGAGAAAAGKALCVAAARCALSSRRCAAWLGGRSRRGAGHCVRDSSRVSRDPAGRRHSAKSAPVRGSRRPSPLGAEFDAVAQAWVSLQSKSCPAPSTCCCRQPPPQRPKVVAFRPCRRATPERYLV